MEKVRGITGLSGKMTDFNQLLAELDSREIDFVFARSETASDNAALEKSGLSWGWLRNRDSDKLGDIARKIRIDENFKARRIIKEALQEAAKVKVKGLKSRDERIKQACSTEILDRELGKPTQRTEVTGQGGGEITVTIRGLDD